MRPLCQNPLTIRGRTLGGPLPLICVPLAAGDRASLMDQANGAMAFQPDMIEWRADRFESISETEEVLSTLTALRAAIGNTPLIFTCRHILEGGFQEIPREHRLELNLKVIASGLVDIVDTELANGEAMVEAIRNACRKSGTRLILSYHNFDDTPGEVFILDRLAAARKMGGDIAKVAVMPKHHGDVLTLLSATYRARTEIPDIPLITVAMGAVGVVSRIAGGLFGSDLTFAVVSAPSAPGQTAVHDLRNAWSALAFN